MGAALALRWQAAGGGSIITVIEPDGTKRSALRGRGILAKAHLPAQSQPIDIVVLAVKPQSAVAAIESIRRRGHRIKLVISVMAGVPIKAFSGIATHAARVMPNTPAIIGEGMSVIAAPTLPAALRRQVQTLFEALGRVAFVARESDLHAVTAISGSGPAYLFVFMEALIKAGTQMGLGADMARTLVTQTMKGSALLADKELGDVARLRSEVTSPKGTTEAALKTFKKNRLARVVSKAAMAARKRSKQLGK